MKKLVFFVLFFSIVIVVFGQTKPKNKRIERLFKKALSAYTLEYYDQAERYCKKVIKRDKHFTGGYVLYSQIEFDQGHYLEAIKYIKRAIKIDTNYAQAYIQAAEYYLAVDSLDIAKKYALQGYRLSQDENIKTLALKYVKIADFRQYQYQHPQKIVMHRLPNSINTTADEYFPTISADGSVLYYTHNDGNEDIYFSLRVNDTDWTEGMSLSPMLNTEYYNEGAHTFTSDGKKIIFTRCFNSCNIYFSEKKNDIWTEPVIFPSTVNIARWNTQPCISSDGRTLYFVSNSPKGKGGADIWVSHYLGNGRWSKAENLGDSINTDKDDMSPVISFDNKTLFFVSNGRIGMGGFDIYMAKKDSNGVWHSPVNLGYPINNKYDQFRLIVDHTGKTAYISSYTDSIYKLDLYYFTLPKPFRPTPTFTLKLHVFDDITHKKLKANILVIDLKNKDTVFTDYSDYFVVPLPQKGIYAVDVLPPKGYLFYSENIDLRSLSDTVYTFEKDLYIKPITKASKIILQNILFDFDSWKLKSASYSELDKLVLFLKNNPKVKIEVGGHTDNKGSSDYNMELSEKRAKAVAEYIISKGIDPQRVSYKGYGYTQPIADNSTEEGRRLNRRTEIKIIMH